jgi:hypothetical protein
MAAAELYLGKGSLEATLKSAVRPVERCQAHFYIGQWHIVRSEYSAAEAALSVAVDICSRYSPEYFGALVDINHIRR